VVLGIRLPGQENAMQAGSRDRVDRRLAAIPSLAAVLIAAIRASYPRAARFSLPQ
jgi:hypothetical protein